MSKMFVIICATDLYLIYFTIHKIIIVQIISSTIDMLKFKITLIEFKL